MRQRGEHPRVVFEDSILAAKVMRGRIALQLRRRSRVQHCVQNPTRNRFGFTKALGVRPVLGSLSADKNPKSIDATTYGVVISRLTLCVAPSAGLVMTRSSIPVNRAMPPASAAAANV